MFVKLHLTSRHSFTVETKCVSLREFVKTFKEATNGFYEIDKDNLVKLDDVLRMEIIPGKQPTRREIRAEQITISQKMKKFN